MDLVLQVNGTQVLAPYLLVCDAGNYSTIGAPSPQLSGPTRYRFASWSDGGSGSHIVTCSANGNLTAFFSTEYQITLDSVPAARSVWLDNISYTTPATVWCPQGAARIVNVFPQEEAGRRFTFANWSDGGAQNHTLACDGPRTLSAIFTVDDLVGLFSSPIRAVILVDGTAHFAPDAFWCREGSAHVLEAPSPQVDNASRSQYRFTGWADGAPPVRTIMCARPTNFTAFFEAISPPPPELPPAPGPGYPILVLTVIALAVFLPVLLVWWLDWRRRPGGPPVTQVAPLTPSVQRCPACGSPAGPDWTFCMQCGAPLR